MAVVLALSSAHGDHHRPTALTGTPEGHRPAVSPPWATDPRDPGFELPTEGRSLFDHLVARAPDGRVPFPFEALFEHVEAQLEPHRYFDSPVLALLIPRGRSLQREAAAPDYFHSPRAVIAADAGPRADEGDGGLHLQHRLYVGYMESADVLEVISYNEADARFEFQLVRDYSESGARRIVYANRTLCTACHQNAAPIFARPLWDETNANGAVALRLEGKSRDFYGFPLRAGVDVAYAYDNATDQANLLATYQRLWQEGCGDGPAGAACRGALLEAALQYGLSDRRAYRRDGRFQRRFQDRIDQRWPGHFPKGLAVPDADIPNRTVAPDAEGPVHVPGHADALRLRAPADTWDLGEEGTQVADKLVAGLAAMLSPSDLRRIDRGLAGGHGRTLHADCRVTEATPPAKRLRVDCDGDMRFSLRLRRDGEAWSGATRRFSAGPDTLLDLAVRGPARRGDGPLRLSVSTRAGDVERTVRLGDGSGLRTLVIDRSGPGSATATAHLDDGTRRLREVVDALIAGTRDDGATTLDDRPFRRAAVMPAVEDALGLPARDWCCVDNEGLPPLAADVYEAEADASGATAVADAGMSLFFSYCGSCHRSADAFPPNFLAGSPARVEEGIARCSERIVYRLGMWSDEPDAGTRSPMPPHAFVYRAGMQPDDWRSSDHYRQLLAYAEARLESGAGEHDNRQSVLEAEYASLAPCLPAMAHAARHESGSVTGGAR